MLSEALRLIRLFHDLKQNELADRLEISKSYLSEIENGKKAPSIDLIEKYSKQFDIPVSSIMFFSENLDQPSLGEDFSDKARGLIARKVIDFLNFIDKRSETNA